MNYDQTILSSILQFLCSINIPVVEETLPADTFLPGLTVRGSNVIMDPEKLKYPGDLLHEAGHIAVTEADMRPLIGTDALTEEWPTAGEEIVAMLWSFAACRHIGLELEVVFHPDGYKGGADWLIDEFNNERYLGLPLLDWMGLCTTADFPKMNRWLRQ